jgi:imidazolonepropionase
VSLLLRNIRTLVHTEATPLPKICGMAMNDMQCLDNAYILIEDSMIKEFGKETTERMNDLRKHNPGMKELDAQGGSVFPSW